MGDFVTVATIDELQPGGEPIVVEIGSRWVAVFNIEGTYYAIEDVCTHDDGPLAEGEIDGWHAGWTAVSRLPARVRQQGQPRNCTHRPQH